MLSVTYRRGQAVTGTPRGQRMEDESGGGILVPHYGNIYFVSRSSLSPLHREEVSEEPPLPFPSQ